MAKSFVELGVNDSGFNAKIKNALHTFAQLGQAATSAKGSFSKMAEGIAKVADAQQLVNTVMKGNPYGLLASAATAAFTKIIEKATEATTAERIQMEQAQKRSDMVQQANEAVGRSTGELMAKYEMLRTAWVNLSSDQERNTWIQQNQNAFKGLNLAVTDVTSAENVFVKNTSQVVAALKARAEAEAYAELYKEQIKKNATKKATGAYNPQTVDSNYRPTLSEAELAGLTNEDYEHKTTKIWSIQKGRYVDFRENTGKLNKSGLQKIQALRNMGAASLEMADQQDATYWANKMLQAQQDANMLGKGFFGASVSGGGRGGSTKTGPTYAADSIAAMEAEVSMLTKAWKEAGAAVRDDYAAQLKEAQLRLDNVMGKDSSIAFNPEQAARQLEVVQGKNVAQIPLSSDVSFGEWLTGVQDQLANLEFEPIEIPIESTQEDIEAIVKSARTTAEVVGSIGDAFNAIEDPAAKVMGTVAQAVASVALSYAQAMVQAGSMGPWAWIAFAASGLATMISTISAIHSSTGYAEGGIVSGTSYSGDNIPIMANAGELVLTKAQQNTLAQNLQGSGMGSMNLKTRVKGTELLVWLDNSLAQSGRGELVTWGQ